jgi:hypothetical protein
MFVVPALAGMMTKSRLKAELRTGSGKVAPRRCKTRGYNMFSLDQEKTAAQPFFIGWAAAVG